MTTNNKSHMRPINSNSKQQYLLLLAALSITFLCDRWIAAAKIDAQNSFDGSQLVLIATIVSYYMIIGICLFFYWQIIHKSSPQFMMSLFYISIGLFLTFYNLVAIYTPTLQLKTINFLYPFSASHLILMVGAFIVWMGFINLFQYQKQSSNE